MHINLFESVKQHKYTTVIFVALCALTVAALAYGLAQRPLELISEAHSPGDTVIDVYSTRVVTQYVHPVANTISGIAFSLAKDAPLPPEDTPIIVRVTTGQDKAQVHQIELPLLLRVKNIQSWAELVFTNHPYTPEGGTQDYPIGFYRPITYSLIPIVDI